MSPQQSHEPEPTCTENDALESAIKVFRVVEWDAIKGEQDTKHYAMDVLRRAGF
jgi:hypothetical protein